MGRGGGSHNTEKGLKENVLSPKGKVKLRERTHFKRGKGEKDRELQPQNGETERERN